MIHWGKADDIGFAPYPHYIAASAPVNTESGGLRAPRPLRYAISDIHEMSEMTSGIQPFFKIDLQLGTDLPPILTVACPFFCDIHHRKIQHFQKAVIRREDCFALGHFP